jgi:FAD/FMN-containing dehydrogenase
MARKKTFYKEADLIEHIKEGYPSFYFSSQTSTVIPYEKIEKFLGVEGDTSYFLCDLSKLPCKYEVTSEGELRVRGPMTWKDARLFLNEHGRTIKTSPTEELALILAGAATSCTGERCFGYGNLRSQIKQIKYLDHSGVEQTLSRDKKLKLNATLKRYAADFQAYEAYKNAPYPRFEVETDLMIGTEGQLGVITEMVIETAELFPVTYFFLLLPRWEEDFEPHMEIFEKVQDYREQILSCELLDSNAFSYLKPEDRLGKNQDVLFLEVKTEFFEEVYENFLDNLSLGEDAIFEISEAKFHHVRASVPRAVFEENSRMGVVKMGTDVQVDEAHFAKLLKYYRECAKNGVPYNLFGHFGDAHLHYNFMPLPANVPECQEQLEKLYKKVLKWKGSPFAEHGIGIIKQKYIKDYWSQNQYEAFAHLKKEHDPKGQFFPQGFMSIQP